MGVPPRGPAHSSRKALPNVRSPESLASTPTPLPLPLSGRFCSSAQQPRVLSTLVSQHSVLLARLFRDPGLLQWEPPIELLCSEPPTGLDTAGAQGRVNEGKRTNELLSPKGSPPAWPPFQGLHPPPPSKVHYSLPLWKANTPFQRAGYSSGGPVSSCRCPGEAPGLRGGQPGCTALRPRAGTSLLSLTFLLHP